MIALFFTLLLLFVCSIWCDPISLVTNRKYGCTQLTHYSKEIDYVPKIGYHSYQAITQYDLDNPRLDYVPHVQHPIEICYTTSPSPSKHTFEEIRQEYAIHEAAWKRSKSCKNVKQQFSTLADLGIQKIVGFGLGDLQGMGERAGARSHTQHAAVRTIAKTLKRTTGRDIQCFVQDPVYSETDKEFLRSIGIVVLDDPKGFLEVGTDTLVFTVSPNVPVKQIIADLQWPAAMIWDTVKPESAGAREWRTEVWDGHEHRVRLVPTALNVLIDKTFASSLQNPKFHKHKRQS
jgi:hypothetical protein